MNYSDDKERRAVEQAVGHFILDLGMIENTMIQALAVLTGVPQTQAHFLLNKTAGGAKIQLLKEAAKAKGIDLKASGLNKALGAIHDIMSFRNRLTHDAIALHGPTQKWMLGQGSPDGDTVLGEARIPLEPEDLRAQSKLAWSAIKVIGDEILIKLGDFTYVTTHPDSPRAIPPFEYSLSYEPRK
ncbi:hypothetical protein SAMN05216374_5946 [Tardiphaga sp. OK246]|uniref:hypothetical protein n=1 Tax=Tardiphaga sp. OK246 TaxID=1855307 RepID=UPI000B62827A|nr:hypothetical protein [Tardiphaga sp. OK246]SNT61642.1 hypothetical protein SAMN05216374_5946 [Tardiphaga sp. OK246]